MTTVSADTGLRERNTPLWIIAGLVLSAGALALLEVTFASLDRPTQAVVFGSLALAAYVAGLLCLVAGRQDSALGLGRWRLGSWMLLWCGAAFGLASLTWIQQQIGTTAQITVSSVLRALWLVAVGITAFAVGYSVGPGQLARRRASHALGALGRRFSGRVRGPATPWILYAVGVGSRLILVATTGRFGYVGDPSAAVSAAASYQQVLNLLSLFAPLAVAAAAIRVFSERVPGAWITLAMIFSTELAFGAAAGGKQSFVIAVLAVVIPFTAAHRRMPKTALAALCIAFLLIVIPFNQAYRNEVRGSSAVLSPSQGVAAAPGILQQTLSGSDALTTIPDSVAYLLQRLREIDGPAIIIQRTPSQVAYSSPLDLVLGPIATIVPRAIWPDKPIMATGYQLSQQYYGLPSTLYSSSAITPVGDLYRHGGWVPVLAGMFFLGCVVRLLDDTLDVFTDPHAIFLLLLLFPSFVKAETDWVTLIAGIPGTVLLWLVAVAITFGARTSK